MDLIINKELLTVFNRSIEIIKEDSRCLGAWHFGSVSRGLQDEFSDVDPVFLVDEKHFDEFDKDIANIFSKICDKVILICPEDFNSNSLKNYGVLMQMNNTILQYDIFIINSEKVSEPFCKIHYKGCTEKNIIFDRNNAIKELLNAQEMDNTMEANLSLLIDKYYFNLNECIKYYFRKDIFKLLNVLQQMFHVHTNLLLSVYQKTSWGGWDTFIKHNLPKEKQKNLLNYFCTAEIKDIKDTLYICMELFFMDAKEVCIAKGIEYFNEKEYIITQNFKKNVQ